jgi:signal transduction histidine kinase/ActR/RegA family two-component response regulator
MTFRRHLLVRFGLTVGIILTVYFVLSTWNYRQVLDSQQEEKLEELNASLEFAVRSGLRIYQERVDSNLMVARSLAGAGVTLDPGFAVEMDAENQITGEVIRVVLPGMVINGNLESLQFDYVDTVTELVGGTVTLFQLFDGGLLRVSTSVKRRDGTRGVETFIPNLSPVTQAIRSGMDYRGRAFVVDSWYLTAYEPIFSTSGEIIGALYVGINQGKLPEMIEAVHSFQTDDTRFAFILDDEGTLIAGPPEAVNGGIEPIKKLIAESARLDNLQQFKNAAEKKKLLPLNFEREDAGEGLASYLAKVAYIPEMAWYVVMAESLSSRSAFLQEQLRTYLLMAAGLMVAILGFLVVMSRGVARPLNQMSEAVLRIARRDFDAEIPKNLETDELKYLGTAFTEMSADLKDFIGQLETAKQRAEAAEAAQATFLATMSHEIRTPMNAVLGMTRLLGSTQLSPEQAGYTETIRTSGDVLLSVINDILDYSKIRSGKLELDPVAFLVRKCVNDVHGLLAVRAEEKEIGFLVDIAANVPEVLVGDMTRIRQILLNLCGNAIKFTEVGGVRLAVHGVGREDESFTLTMAVEDTGIGITPEQKERLFQPFQQATAATARRHGGTGLGLVISRHLAHLMGGSIDYTPRKSGGSVFKFKVELPIPTQDTPLPARVPQEEKDLKVRLAETCPLKVLVVEDNAVNRRVIQSILRKLGYAPDLVTNGKEAVEKVQEKSYDLILMDIQMPVMDGLEATQAIRQLPEIGQKVFIAALTAGVMLQEREQANEAGMDAFLAKPLRIHELTTVIMQACQRIDPDCQLGC